MPRFSKAQFKEMIQPDGRVSYMLPRMVKDTWVKMSIDQKNELATDDQVEDGFLLTDVGLTTKDVGSGQIDIEVNADASEWNSSEE
jgi:hypothetical protein